MRFLHFRVAILWQIGLAAYFQLISWIPLGRFNYQPCCHTGLEQIRLRTLTFADVLGLSAFLLPVLVFSAGVRLQLRWVMWLALAPYAVWLGLQLWTWWPPYLFGASQDWSQVYARAFAESIQILPQWGNHLPPDAVHLLLQVLLLGVLLSGVSGLVRRQPVQAG